MYSSYLMLLSQLKQQIHIKVICDDIEIFIDTCTDSGLWKMQARLFNGRGELPHNVKEILSSMHLFRWQSIGPHLSADPKAGTVDLITNMPPISEYTEFKQVMIPFLEVYSLWKELISEKKALSI